MGQQELLIILQMAQNLIKKGEPILINDVEMTENNLFDYWSQQKGLKNID